MTSIAENITNIQRGKNASFHMIDHIDNFDKLICQSRAVVSALIVDDALTSLTPATISNLLWIIGDRLDEMKQLHHKMQFEVLQ
ncbi:hypothetical protein [Rheinheimera sp. MMS21-TC3]|uniref:hypothetical protein n=1 Tax=Rheinheimera sp. MMS21-TC3 TaxID=3072790 RepID=UPI0028C49050|nr:hypothetical protein [Rheinheimera sp. MMS21-TC3]WNO60893.1 hypothetical protein RDV63_07990 [Rheinheimera sp. MMS21-TC3]